VTLRDFYHDKLGLKESYGPAIISFTVLIRLLILPLTFKQLKTSSQTQALSPKIAEIKEKFPDNKEVQNQLIALLYQETNTNPFAGCLPALIQIPVFLALYRSFLALASTNQMAESFLWLPNLEGPVFGTRSTDWVLANWDQATHTPPLGWHDTLLYLTIPLMLFIAQTVSLNFLSPPSDDPTVQKTQVGTPPNVLVLLYHLFVLAGNPILIPPTLSPSLLFPQRVLKYLPLLLAYFSLSVPAGLGLYWITNNVLSTVGTVSIKEYYKRNQKALDFDIDKMITSPFYLPAWGYTSQEQVLADARLNEKPLRTPKIPESFI
jgi:YidC/Oxa1 family membrane protein insertase